MSAFGAAAQTPARRGPRVFVSAGEASGDAILGPILSGLRARIPDLELAGLGGPAAAACGLAPLFPISRTAFSGAWDVIANLPFAWRMLRAADRELRRFRPDLVLLIDYPGLNLRLARKARAFGCQVHFVAPPQVWAYRAPADRPSRKLRRARAALAGCSLQTLFPFEAAYWEGKAASVRSGHFQDTVPSQEPEKVLWEIPKPGFILLCPGSRLPVLRRNLPAWLRLLRKAGIPAAAPMAVLAPAWLAAEARALVDAHAPERAGHCTVRSDKAAAFAEAGRAIAFPGTITLELALHRVPTLVLALIDPLTYAVGKRLLRDRRLALPNLLLDEGLFPEWAGTLPGPDADTFRGLWAALDTPWATWDTTFARLADRLGPGNGTAVAVEACLELLLARSAVEVTRQATVGVTPVT